MRVTHKMAVERLKAAGYVNAAKLLGNWRSQFNTLQGWDGWFRKEFADAEEIIHTVWEDWK